MRYLIRPAGEQLWLIFDVLNQKNVDEPQALEPASKCCCRLELLWEEQKRSILRAVNGGN